MPATAAQWHILRHARILANHPEVRLLQGTYPFSKVFIVALVAAEVTLAWAVRNTSWPVLLALAFGVGAFISHALGVLIHECTHNLVAQGSRANKIWMLVANLPLLAPAAIEFRAQHLLHHKYLGEVDGRDTQAPSRDEIAFVGANPWRKFASFTFGRFFYRARPTSRVPRDVYFWVNWGIQIPASIALFFLVGGKGVSFLAISGLLAFGPHPVGARRLSEHFAMRTDQPTVSYYGLLNWVAFDVGYHVEHHDFPAIPWPRMRALRRMAGEEYDTLFAFGSWSRLLLAHVFDRRYRVEHYVGFGSVLESEPSAAPSTLRTRCSSPGQRGARNPSQQHPGNTLLPPSFG